MRLICRRDAEGWERRRIAMTAITERKQAEEPLREPETYNLASHTSTGKMVISLEE